MELLPHVHYPIIDISDQIDEENTFLRNLNESNVTELQCRLPNFYYLENAFHVIPEWAEALLTAGNILVIIFAFCGNIAALFVLWKSRSSKKSTVLFLGTLAVSDLILVASAPTIDLGAIMDRYHSWIFGRFLCKAIPFVQSMAVVMNSFCLLAIALERYLSVVCAFRISVLTVEWQTRLPYISLLIMWIISTGVTLPNIWSYEHYSFWTWINNTTRPRNETCETYYFCNRKPDFDEYNVIYYISLGVMFCSLLVGFLFCYLSILRFVSTHGLAAKSGANENNYGANVTHIRQRRTTYLVIGLILVFSICRVPLWTFNIVANIKKIPQSPFIRSLTYSLHLLSNFNCVIQPFMYAIWNDSLRTGSNQATTSHLSENRDEQVSCCLMRGISKLCKHTCCSRCCCCKKVNLYEPNSRNDETIRSYPSTQKYFLSSKNEFPGLSYLSSEYT